MTRFLIGQVCSALGVKPHVLRYWERHIDLLSPAKDRSGRRVYTFSDVQLMFRIRYLIYTRGMSVEGASRKIFEEVRGGGPNRKAAIGGVRGELLRASLGVQRLKRRISASTGEAPNETAVNTETIPDLDAVRSRMSVRRRFTLDGELRDLETEPTRTLLSTVRTKLGSASSGAEVPSSTRRARRGDRKVEQRDGRSGDLETVRHVLDSSPLLVVTPWPEQGHTAQSYPGLLPLLGRRFETVLDQIGRGLAIVADKWGRAPQWIVAARGAPASAVRDHFAYRDWYGLPPERLRVVEEPLLPVLSGDGRLVIDSAGGIPRYELSLYSALYMMARTLEDPNAGSATPQLGLVLPATNALPNIPDVEFIARHLAGEEDVSLKVVRAEGGLFPTGEALIRTEVLPALLRRIHLHTAQALVRRFSVNDDIVKVKALRAELGPKDVLAAAGRGAVFEIDPGVETAFLRSAAEWESCSRRVREKDT